MIRITLYILAIPIVIFLAITPNIFEMGIYTDKVLHVFTFCMVMLHLTLKHELSKTKLALYVIMLLALGASIELLQSFTPNREAQLSDMIANTLGIALGLLIRYLLRSGYYATNKQ